MDVAELLTDGFARVQEAVHEAVVGLSEDQLAHRPDPHANSIAWLVWHLARVQDDHVADVARIEQVYISQGFYQRFDLPFDPTAHGYGHSSEQVGQVRAPAELLVAYYDAVHAATVEFVRGLRPADLDRVVDTRFDPPVTLGVRLVSVISDDLQHAGQSAYLRGLLERAEPTAT
jgi:hypothetical protein